MWRVVWDSNPHASNYSFNGLEDRGDTDPMNHCLTCSKETTNPKYCCKTCSAITNNKLFPKRKSTRKCFLCDNIVKSYRHTRCESHWNEYKENNYKNKTLGEYRNKLSVKGKHPSWINAHVRSFARSWHRDLTQLPCAHCGYTKHVELAHIKDIVSFSDECLLSEVNARNNIIQLCPNCHWEFDNLPR